MGNARVACDYYGILGVGRDAGGPLERVAVVVIVVVPVLVVMLVVVPVVAHRPILSDRHASY